MLSIVDPQTLVDKSPLLFIIYINDIPQVSKFSKFILYADEANIILTRNNIAKINVLLYDHITEVEKLIFFPKSFILFLKIGERSGCR